MSHTIKTSVAICLGLAARLMSIKYFKDVASYRVEALTPLNDWKRAKEALFLQDQGLDPYAGNIFHEDPVHLHFYRFVYEFMNIEYIIPVVDVLTALMLKQSSGRQLALENQEEKTIRSASMYIFYLYLFSPLSLLSCASLSTSTFANFFVASILFIQPFRILKPVTCLLCALLTCNSIYYMNISLPIFLCVEYASSQKQGNSKQDTSQCIYYKSRRFRSSLYTSVMLYLIALVTVSSVSFVTLEYSCSYFKSVYLFAMKVEDLKPNVGMFWYFFTEMFDQFLDFFTWVVQINAFIHMIPVSIYLRDKPFFLLYMLMLISTIFQPYPSLSQINFILCLLPQWWNYTNHMKYGLVIACATLTCMSLWPIFWHLWIVLGTANSNFYFGATLAFSSAMILLMIDLFNSHGYITAKLQAEEYKKRHNLEIVK